MEIRKKTEIDKSVRKSTRCYAIHDGKVVTIKYKNKEKWLSTNTDTTFVETIAILKLKNK